jgi:hypothetical protein
VEEAPRRGQTGKAVACRDVRDGADAGTRGCRLKQYAEYVRVHLPLRSLDRVSENELRIELALPHGEYTTLSVVFHPLTGKLAKAEVRSSSHD